MSSSGPLVPHSAFARALVLVCGSLDAGADPGRTRTEALATLASVRASCVDGRSAADAALQGLASLTPRSLRVLALPHLFSGVAKLSLTRAGGFRPDETAPSASFGSWPSVTELDLSYTAVTADTLHVLMAALPNVTSLSLRGVTVAFPRGAGLPPALAAVAPRLARLDVSCSTLTLQHIAALLPSCARLESLDMAHVENYRGNSDAATDAVADLAAQGVLVHLNFCGSDLDYPAIVKAISACLAAGRLARVVCGKASIDVLRCVRILGSFSLLALRGAPPFSLQLNHTHARPLPPGSVVEEAASDLAGAKAWPRAASSAGRSSWDRGRL